LTSAKQLGGLTMPGPINVNGHIAQRKQIQSKVRKGKNPGNERSSPRKAETIAIAPNAGGG